MSAKAPFATPNPDLRFRLFALLLLTSFVLCPVNSRPSTPADNPQLPNAGHGNTDIMAQQSESMGNGNQQVEQETEDEDYPQQDMSAIPMADAPGNNGARKGEAKHPKSSQHSGKSARRNGVGHHSVAKPVQEGNDTNDGAPEDLDRSSRNGSGSNMTTSEENYMKLSKNNRESQELDQADRNKVLRINEIKERIQNYRLGSPMVEPRPTNVPIKELVKMMNMDMNITHSSPLDAYPMKRRSVHPSCTAPNNTDIDLWTNGNSMNLLFNLTYPAQQNTTVTIIAATLRLYKFAQGNNTLMAHACRPVIGSPNSHDHEDEEEQEQEQDQEPQGDNPLLLEVPELPTTPGTVMTDDDKQLRVSVYWYTRSLKKNKVKRKLLDSRMMPVYGKGGWIEFNVRTAVRQWRLLGKNFGLVVEVENEDGELLKASDYFTAMNCSDEASTSRPLPRVLLQAAQSYLESNYASASTGFDISPIIASGPEFTYTNPISNAFPDIAGRKEAGLGDDDTPRRIINSPYIYSFLFPVIDLCTIDVPAQEAANVAFLHQAQYLLTQYLAACKNGNLQNHTDFMLMYGTTNPPTQIHLMTEETNKTENLDVNNQTEELNNISHIHHEGHKKDHRHNGHHTAPRLASIPEEMFPAMQDSPRAVKIRHSRHHLDEKQRLRTESGNHQFEETMKRRITDGENEKESEEFKEQVTWTDENDHEFKKIIFQEVIRSANPHDATLLPQRESDR